MQRFESVNRKPLYKTPNPFDVEDLEIEPSEVIVKDGLREQWFDDNTGLIGDDHGEELHDVIPPSKGHDENLAEWLPEFELKQIGQSLKRLIEEDVESQQQNFDAVAKFIRNLGIDLSKEYTLDELPFDGASTVYSMAAFDSVVEIVSLASTEIFKSSGMVDSVVLGESSDEAQDVAARKKEWFNYYFDVVDKGFRKEANRTIAWAAVAGSIYKKVFNCPVLGRPVSLYIPFRDFIVNKDHSSHFLSTRKTHILRLSENEYKMRVASNMYRNIEVLRNMDMDDEDNPIQSSLDAIEGYNPSIRGQKEPFYKVYECHVDYHIKGDPASGGLDIALPYVISIDAKSGNILSLNRNWKEGDPLKKRKEYFVNYSMLPALEGEGYGLVHCAGKSSEAATSLLRLIMNTAKYANFPGGIFHSNARLANNSMRPSPGEWIPVQSTGTIPISQSFMPFPYSNPSPELFTLKDQLEDSIRKPSAIIGNKLIEVAPKAPVGSVAMMLDGMHKVPNAILQNIYESFGRELELYEDRFSECMPKGQPYSFKVPGGEFSISQEDFQSHVKVVPSADPTTKNSTYRMMISEIMVDKATKFPEIHNLPFAFKYFYKNIGVCEQDIQQLLSPDKGKQVEPPPPLDPISTIMALAQGQPVEAAVWQEHTAYITIITTWIQENPQSPHIPQAIALKEKHEALQYMVDTCSRLGIELPSDPSQLSPEEQNQIAIAVAQMKMEEAQAQQDQSQPPEPPLDPARVALEEIHTQAQIAQEKHDIEMRRLEFDNKKADMEYAIKEQEINLKFQIEHLKQDLEAKKAEVEAFKIENDQILKERDQALKERDSALEEHREQHTEVYE